jgi:16S rRNA (guanine(966)-N(2))-methyltransferase RsmD
MKKTILRIIGGRHRGRKISAPPAGKIGQGVGATTRPVTHRVKEALFDVLATRIEGAIVADCFAGPGSMGLEALSRGAAFACFIEKDRKALTCLRENIATLGLQDETAVVADDIFRLGWNVLPRQHGLYTLFFIDPPYSESHDSKPGSKIGNLMESLSEWDGRSKSGLAVLRHQADALVPDSYDRLALMDRREYGGMVLSFYGEGE